jgi:hypothetical protein
MDRAALPGSTGSKAIQLVLLRVRVRTGIGLAVHVGERRGGGGALLLVLVLLRLLLFLVVSHLTFRHGVLQVLGGDSQVIGGA